MRVRRSLTVAMALVAALLAAGNGAAYALPGSTGSITGTVTDAGGPVQDVVVELWADSEGGMAYTGHSTTTGFSGGYAITGIPAGTYEVRAYDPARAHYNETSDPIAVAGGSVVADVVLASAGSFAGSVRDAGAAPLAGADVYLFPAGAPGFPDAPDPDPGATAAGPGGAYRIWDVVDPFADFYLAGDFTLAAFEPGHVAQFYDRKATPGLATPKAMVIGAETSGIDFTLTPRSRTPLPPKTALNGAASSVPSNKGWVRRAGDSWAVWHDDVAGGLVLRATPQGAGAERILAPGVSPYDGAWDVNATTVFLADGRVYDAASGTLSRTLSVGKADDPGASDPVVACDGRYVAYLYRVASTDFRTRTWRLRVFDTAGGFAFRTADLVRPMDEAVRLQPGGTSGGLTAVTSSPEAPSEGATSSVIAFDYGTSTVTTVRELVSVGGGDRCESVIVNGSNVIYADADVQAIRQVPVSGGSETTLVDASTDPFAAKIGDITGDGAGDFLYALSNGPFTFGTSGVWCYQNGENVETAGFEWDGVPFDDFDFASALSGPGNAALLRGVNPYDTTHVFATSVAALAWTRVDAVDRPAPVEQQAPDVSGRNAAWIDWRDDAYWPDVYVRREGAAEERVASTAYAAIQEMGLPQVSERWVVYPMPDADPYDYLTSHIVAHDLTGGPDVAVASVVAPSDGAYYYPTLCGLAGDWFVWADGADRTARVELRMKNIATGEQRLLTAIDVPAAPYTVYFKASGGKVLYVDAAGTTQLYDIATATKRAVPGLPLQASFDAFAFDYPRAAYIGPLVEDDDRTEYRGPLKAFDFRTDSTSVVEQFLVIKTARPGGQPIALWRHALVAGTHVFDLTTGREYGFGPAAERVSFASVDGTRAVVEAPETPGGVNDVFSLDLSSFADAVPPVTSVSGVPSGVATLPVSLGFSAADGMSGVDRMRISVQPQGTAYSGASPTTVTIASEGAQTVTYSSVDLWGNEETSKTVTVVYDRAPQTSLVVDAGVAGVGGWYRSSVTFHLTASDTGSGVATTWLSIDGAPAAVYSGGGRTLSSEGTHTVEYWSVDRNGIAESRHVDTFKVDATGPSITSDLRAGYEGAATITFSITDRGVGLREVQVWSGGSWSTWSAPWVITDATPGDHTITLRAFDEHDNRRDFTASYFIGAVGPPTTTLNATPAPNANGWNRLTGPTVTLTATDSVGGLPGSGVRTTYYKIGSVTTAYAAPFPVTSPGTTIVEYWSVDWAGNQELPHKTATIRFDGVDPTVTHDAVPYYEGAGTITVTGHDSTSGPWRTEYRLDGATGFTSGPDGAPVTFSIGGVGAHSFEYLCTDRAGNQSAYAARPSFSYFVGAVSTPVTTIGGVPAGVAGGAVPLTLTAVDAAGGQPGSGVKATYYTLDGGPPLTYVAPFTVSKVGTTTVEYWSVDNVGNEETPKTAVVRIGQASPLPVYRFYNFKKGVHFYTASAAEADIVRTKLAFTFRPEGVAYSVNTANALNSAPLYRFYNFKKGVHFYTASAAEADSVRTKLAYTFRDEGVAYNVSDDTGGMPVYRFYNVKKGVHFFTASAAEADIVRTKLAYTFRDEGVAYYVAP